MFLTTQRSYAPSPVGLAPPTGSIPTKMPRLAIESMAVPPFRASETTAFPEHAHASERTLVPLVTFLRRGGWAGCGTTRPGWAPRRTSQLRRLALGEELRRPTHALEALRQPEDFHRLEQRRRRRLAGDRDAQRHEEVADLHAELHREVAQRRLVAHVLHVGVLREQLAARGEHARELGRRELGAAERLLREHDLALEEVVGPLVPLGELLHALLDQRDDPARHRAIDLARRTVGARLLRDEGDDAVGELVGREAADPLAVQPLELGEVEDRAAEGDLLQVEPLEQLRAIEDLGTLALGRREAHQREEVDQRLGQVALRLVPLERGRV